MSAGSTEFDAVLTLCRDRLRRLVLAVLAAQQRPLTLNDLSKAIVRHDRQTPLAEVSEETLRDIRIRLHHVHVPKLADEGLVEYDRKRHLVDPTERFDRVRTHLSAILESDPTLEPPTEL